MQDVENNIDDLFRKAAENYKPNAGESNWNIIKPQLLNHKIASAMPVAREKNKALLLLLLLPLAAGVLIYHYAFNTEKKSDTAVQYSIIKNQQDKKNNSIISNKKITEPAAKPERKQKNIANAQLNSAGIKNDEMGNYVSIKNIPETNINNKYAKEGLPALMNKSIQSLTEQQDAKPAFLQDTTAKNFQAPAAQKVAIVKQKKFYAGVLSGSSFNEVKHQGFKKAGFNAGVITGYKLNKNIAVETGIVYSTKYYYSDGKYFNMEKMPVNMKVLSLKGSCNVFEIPVNIKYNIIHKSTSAVFASAGVSSLILTKESNEYLASVNNNTPQNLKGLYKSVSAGFASSVNLSAGYEHAIGKQANIRIQPYLQIPLKGVGVGKIQVMSTGINIAITRPFH